MTLGFQPIDNWETLVAFVAVVLVVGFVLALVLARDRVTHRVRFGVFVEREIDDRDDQGADDD